MIRTIALNGRETGAVCWGRNASFVPAAATIAVEGARVEISVWSHRRGRMAPILVEITPAEAHEIAEALVEVAEAISPKKER